MAQIQIRCCLRQSGNPITFSSIGGGAIGLDFDDSSIPDAVGLLALKDMPLVATFEPDPDGTLIQRRGSPKNGE
jgi:hypothetical protein